MGALCQMLGEKSAFPVMTDAVENRDGIYSSSKGPGMTTLDFLVRKDQLTTTELRATPELALGSGEVRVRPFGHGRKVKQNQL